MTLTPTLPSRASLLAAVLLLLALGIAFTEAGVLLPRDDGDAIVRPVTDKKYLRSSLDTARDAMRVIPRSPHPAAPRFLQQAGYTQKTMGSKTVLAVRVKSSKDSLVATTVEEANYAASQLTSFFAKSSGNQLLLTFNVQYATTSTYSCSNSAPVDLLSIWSDIVSKFQGTSYDWLVMLLPNCGKFQFTGLSEIGGNRAWIKGYANGDPLSRDSWCSIIAHEMGHLLTANHAAFESNDYGDPYSPMGAGRSLATGDFEVVAKMMFQWLSQASGQYKWYGAVRHPDCIASPSVCETLDIGATRQEWVFPHDNLPSGATFVPGRVYGIKLTLRVPGTYLYLERRARSPMLAGGKVLMSWSSESWALPNGNTVNMDETQYGSSQLIDYDTATFSLTSGDEGMPVGGAFSYKTETESVVVRALQYDSTNGATLVEISYAPLGEQAIAPAALATKFSDSTLLTCGQSITLPALAKTSPSNQLRDEILRVSIDRPGYITLTNSDLSAGYCGITQSEPGNHAIFLYESYPIHQDIMGWTTPGVGAVFSAPLCKCASAVNCASGVQIADEFAVGGVQYEDFSSRNYVLVRRYTGTSSVTVSFTCAQQTSGCGRNFYLVNGACAACPASTPYSDGGSTTTCYSQCSKIRVDSTKTELSGVYTRALTLPFNTIFNAPYFVSPSGDYLLSRAWRGDSAAPWNFVQADNVDEGVVDTLKGNGPSWPSRYGYVAGKSGANYRLGCLCDDGYYGVAWSGSCTKCPSARPFGKSGIESSALCYQRCRDGSALVGSGGAYQGVVFSPVGSNPPTFSSPNGDVIAFNPSDNTFELSSGSTNALVAKTASVDLSLAYELPTSGAPFFLPGTSTPSGISFSCQDADDISNYAYQGDSDAAAIDGGFVQAGKTDPPVAAGGGQGIPPAPSPRPNKKNAKKKKKKNNTKKKKSKRRPAAKRRGLGEENSSPACPSQDDVRKCKSALRSKSRCESFGSTCSWCRRQAVEGSDEENEEEIDIMLGECRVGATCDNAGNSACVY